MSGAVVYRTKAGDMLDRICWEYYDGRENVYDQVLAENPKLASYGPVLPSGLLILLPELPPKPRTGAVKLWE